MPMSQPLQEEQIVAVPTAEIAAVPNKGNFVESEVTCVKQEEACAQTTELDPQTGLLYTMTGIKHFISLIVSLSHRRSELKRGKRSATTLSNQPWIFSAQPSRRQTLTWIARRSPMTVTISHSSSRYISFTLNKLYMGGSDGSSFLFFLCIRIARIRRHDRRHSVDFNRSV